jgi:hypothetical protein
VVPGNNVFRTEQNNVCYQSNNTDTLNPNRTPTEDKHGFRSRWSIILKSHQYSQLIPLSPRFTQNTVSDSLKANFVGLSFPDCTVRIRCFLYGTRNSNEEAATSTLCGTSVQGRVQPIASQAFLLRIYQLLFSSEPVFIYVWISRNPPPRRAVVTMVNFVCIVM